MKSFKKHSEGVRSQGKYPSKPFHKMSDKELKKWLETNWTDEMFDDDEGQEKYFDKPIIGPMEKAFEKYFKKMGYETDITD